MSIVLDGTSGINTPDLESAGPISGTTGTFSGAVTVASVQAGGVATNIYPLVSATAVTASGTAVDFTGIPSWVKRITVMFSGVSTSGTSNPLVQIGSGSFTTSGYLGASSLIPNAASPGSATFTTGFGIANGAAAAAVLHGSLVLINLTANTWAASGTLAKSDAASTITIAGSVTLGGTLDRIRITTVNGTDTFDAGTINIMYEG